MKKFLLLVVCIVMLPAMLFADFSYSLDLLSFDPLHQEYTADRDRAGMDFQWLYVDKFPEGVYQNGTFFKFQKPWTGPMYNVDGYEDMPWMGLIHLGETLSLFRNNFEFDHWLSPISFDFSFQGAMVIGMEGGMADMIGYDGVFFFGGSARIADMVSMRFGAHHYCTHFGDGTIKYLGIEKGLNKGFQTRKKYIRMDAFVTALSVEPIDGIRVYAEYNFLPKSMLHYFDQQIFAPVWKDPDHLCQNKPDDYKAGIVNFGIELSYPIFKKLGKTTLSYDCHAYEEGKIVYMEEDKEKYAGKWDTTKYKAYYDPERPWEFEHELVLSQEVSKTVSFEIGYHNGRFPLNPFYHQRCNYVYVGARFNPDSTVTIVDTAK